MSKARDEFLARENQTVEDRRRGVYLMPLRKKLEQLAPDEQYGLLARLILSLPIKLRRALYLTLSRNLRGDGGAR